MNNSFLLLEDEELEILFRAVNSNQMFFHPQYAPEGRFSASDIHSIQFRDIMIIADNNLIIPISELATKGKLDSETRMSKAALFVLWCTYLGARATCGAGLLENGTNGRATTSIETRKEQFLHAFEGIPAQIWKMLAFGQIEEIPAQFLYRGATTSVSDDTYDCNNEYMYLSNVAAVTKIVILLRTPFSSPFERFLAFMSWYADHLQLADSVIMYAALLFSSIPHVKQPKDANAKDFTKVQNGIRNQAWDLDYLTLWSTLYYDDNNQAITMFATDDITQKLIAVNILPPGQINKSLPAMYKTKAEQKQLENFCASKLGSSRTKPHSYLSLEEKVQVVKELIANENAELQAIVKHKQ